LKKEFRIKLRRDFVRVSSSGFYSVRGAVVVQCETNGLEHFRAGFTATKKIGNAVVRNRCKRRMRAAADALLDEIGLSGIDYVFIAKRSTPSVGWMILLEDMRSGINFLNKKMQKCEKLHYC
jgi:ribonuclease P protein component